jgi:ribosome-binding protein aMBF1 (putative translation factor)
MKAARIEVEVPKKNGKGTKVAVFYVCAECGEYGKPAANKSGHPRVWVDHKEPLVPIDGMPISWDLYLHRLFCGPEDLQVLCEPCHKIKSKEENRVRRQNKKELVGRDSQITTRDSDADIESD